MKKLVVKDVSKLLYFLNMNRDTLPLEITQVDDFHVIRCDGVRGSFVVATQDIRPIILCGCVVLVSDVETTALVNPSEVELRAAFDICDSFSLPMFAELQKLNCFNVELRGFESINLDLSKFDAMAVLRSTINSFYVKPDATVTVMEIALDTYMVIEPDVEVLYYNGGFTYKLPAVDKIEDQIDITTFSSADRVNDFIKIYKVA